MDLSGINWSDTEFITSDEEEFLSDMNPNIPLPVMSQADLDTLPLPSTSVQNIPVHITSQPENILECMALTSTARLPLRATVGSVGLDLCSNMAATVPPQSRIKLSTGLKIAIPEGHYGQIRDKSSIAWKKGLTTMAGIIDSDYRGEIFIVLFNNSSNVQYIYPNEPVAQLIINKFVRLNPIWVETMTVTERGEGGFGSTSI